MKKWITLLIVCSNLMAAAQVSTIRLRVNGLVCSLCTKSVKQALSKIPFVNSIDVDLQTQEYNISYLTSSRQDITRIREAVEGAGFSIGLLQIKVFFGAEIHSSLLEFGGEDFQIMNGYVTGKGEKTLTIIDQGFCDRKVFQQYRSLLRRTQSGAGRTFHAVI